MSELTQQDYARLRSTGQFDTLEAQYFALRARLEAVELERDEMRHYHDCAIEALYDQLGIDKSDGEIRTKWVALEISNLQQHLAAVMQERDEFKRKYHEAMDIMSAWKHIDHAEAVAQLLVAKQQLAAVTQERDELKADCRFTVLQDLHDRLAAAEGRVEYLEIELRGANERGQMVLKHSQEGWGRVRELTEENERLRHAGT